MKLIKCHIENFGKLHNLDIDFNDGCNLIAAENGWGKSTLAAFIKVMFYGFSGLSKKTDANIHNEKIRYTPWQSGSYGGTLEFEAAGKRYTIVRSFDKNAKTNDRNDVYELRDSKTNLLTNDYVNLGQELFGVGAESFARTVFLGQGNSETGMNGEISAMIGNMVDDSNDINNFETVDLKLKSILDGLNPNKKTGELYKKKEMIEKLRGDILRIEDVEQRLNRLVESRREVEGKTVELQSLKRSLQEELDKVNSSNEQYYIAQKYEEAVNNLKYKEEEYDICRSRFGDRVPEERELTDAMNRASVLKQKREKRNIFLALSLVMTAVGIIGLAIKDVYSFVTETLSAEIEKSVFNIVMGFFICLGIVIFAFYVKLKREKAGLDEFFRSVGITADPSTEIQIMIRNVHELNQAKREVDRATSSLKELENKDEFREYIRAYKAKSESEDDESASRSDSLYKKKPTEINGRIREIDGEIDGRMKDIREYDRQIEDAKNQIDRFAESEEELAKLSEEYESEKHRYDNVCITRELITRAKENLGARYVNPMENTFIKYYEQIDSAVTSAGDGKFEIDANGNIRKYELGVGRDIRQLSLGNRDLINFCMRMSMIEAMYEREKPMLILDDPFVNLDSKRYEKALDFLQKLSESYQILYFTCRN